MSAREPSLWPALVEAQRPYLVRYARAKLSDLDVAEDAVQDTLLAALGSEAAFKGEASVRTWLTAILNHKILDEYRRQATRSRRALPGSDAGDRDALDVALDQEALLHAERHDPMIQVELRQSAQRVMAAVSRLPNRQRDVLVLAAVHGRDTREIARAVGISVANVWVILHRARQVLAAEVGPLTV